MFAQLLSESKVYFLFNIQRSILKRPFSFSLQSKLKHYAVQFRKLQKTWAVKPHILIDTNTQRQGGSLISYAERTTRLSNRNTHTPRTSICSHNGFDTVQRLSSSCSEELNFDTVRVKLHRCVCIVLSVRARLCVCVSVTMFPSIRELMGRLGLPCARADNVNRK